MGGGRIERERVGGAWGDERGTEGERREESEKERERKGKREREKERTVGMRKGKRK